MKTFVFDLQTPEKQISSSEAVELNTRAIDGSLTIMADHESMVTALDISILKVKYSDGKSRNFAINGGVMDIQAGNVTINTIEAQEIIGKNENLNMFPKALAAKNGDVKMAIEHALQAGGYYKPDLVTLTLLSEERLAKAEILKEIASER